MVEKKYIPEKGDIVWLNFSPQSGREQAGKRPALVISPKIYNGKTNLAIFVPITSKVKNYPFEVKISGTKIKGVALSDHIKNLDWKSRNASFIEKAPKNALREVLEKIHKLTDI